MSTSTKRPAISHTWPRRLAVIPGAMKCGTTSLYRYLTNHPSVCGGAKKEPNFFLKKDRSIQTYRSQFPHWQPERHNLVLDGSTNYAKYPAFRGAPRNLSAFCHNHNVSVSILYVVRDPYEAVESFYRHVFTQSAPWAQRLALPLDHVPEEILVRWAFATQIDQFLLYFPRAQLKIVTNDQLRYFSSDDQSEFAWAKRAWLDLCGFLDIEPAPLKRKELKHTSVSRAHLRRAVIAKRGMTLEELISWRLSQRARQHVCDLLGPDVARIRDEYGVDIANWEIARDLKLC